MLGDWRVMIGGADSAFHHMALDEQLAREPVARIRLFTWSRPAISFGRKQLAPAWFDEAAWRAAGLEWVERPTGGGIGVHGSDLSVSIVVPRQVRLPVETLMRATCESAVRLCQEFGIQASARMESAADGRIDFCLMEPSAYAVMVGSRKVAGFALRRYPDTWLIQGSMLVQPLPLRLAERLPQRFAAKLDTSSTSLSEASGKRLTPGVLSKRWVEHWPAWWEALLVEELSVA